MRLGVLDIGSNTGHLAVFEVEPGGTPVRVHKFREMLRLADHVGADDALTARGLDVLLGFVRQARVEAGGCDVLPVATATVRDAPNRDEIVAAVRDAGGFELEVLTEEQEAQRTFLAARRWLADGSAGRIGVFDIGGGSLEISVGRGEVPEHWRSWRLGARRLTRDWVTSGRADELRAHVRREIEPHVRELRGAGLDLAVGTSRTMRMLGDVCGSPVRKDDLVRLVDRVADMPVADVKRLPGVPKKRADQVLAGSIVADTAMELFGLETLEICPWALREGVLLDHLDHL